MSQILARAVLAIVSAGAIVSSCRRPPPLPEVDLQSFATPIRQQIEEAQREARAHSGDGDANGRLGMLYHTYRMDEPALVCYRRAVVLDGKNPRWRYFIGLIELRQAKFVESAENLGLAARLDPNTPAIRLRLAEALAGASRKDEAVRVYEELVRSEQALPYAHLGWGRLLESEGKLDESLRHLRLACELAPGYKDALYALAQGLRRKGDSAEVEKLLARHRAAGSLAPPLPDVHRETLISLDIGSNGYISRSVAYDQAGRLDLAIDELTNCLSRHPGNVNALVNLISLSARTGDFAGAERYYRLATASKPSEPAAHFYWGNTLAAQGRYPEAAMAITKTLELNAEFPGAATLLGDLLAVSGRKEEAVQRYRQALRLRPDDPVASAGLGIILAGRGGAAEALGLLEVGRSAPGAARIRVYRALDDVCLRLGETQRREEFLAEARPVIVSSGTMEDNEWLQARLARSGASRAPSAPK